MESGEESAGEEIDEPDQEDGLEAQSGKEQGKHGGDDQCFREGKGEEICQQEILREGVEVDPDHGGCGDLAAD